MRGDAAFPLDNTNTGNTRHNAGIRRLNHTQFCRRTAVSDPNMIYKWVLEFIFASINRSGLLIFFIKIKIVVA